MVEAAPRFTATDNFARLRKQPLFHRWDFSCVKPGSRG